VAAEEIRRFPGATLLMKFSVDHHVLIGQLHIQKGKYCQDYALSRSLPGAAFAVISDGCSKGGETDIGSRLVALLTAQAILGIPSIIHNSTSIPIARQIPLLESISHLGIVANDLLATSIVAYASDEGGFVFIEGDGIVALRGKGELEIFKYSWAKNMPWYPAYGIDAHETERFVRLQGSDLKTESVDVEHWIGDNPGNNAKLMLGEGIKGFHGGFSPEDLADLDCIGIFSDGLCQIEGLDWKDAVRELMSFKAGAGYFVKRRLNAFIEKHLELKQLPQDDLSFAAIRINHDA
jgi:hypothetical protein